MIAAIVRHVHVDRRNVQNDAGVLTPFVIDAPHQRCPSPAVILVPVHPLVLS